MVGLTSGEGSVHGYGDWANGGEALVQDRF